MSLVVALVLMNLTLSSAGRLKDIAAIIQSSVTIRRMRWLEHSGVFDSRLDNRESDNGRVVEQSQVVGMEFFHCQPYAR